MVRAAHQAGILPILICQLATTLRLLGRKGVSYVSCVTNQDTPPNNVRQSLVYLRLDLQAVHLANFVVLQDISPSHVPRLEDHLEAKRSRPNKFQVGWARVPPVPAARRQGLSTTPWGSPHRQRLPGKFRRLCRLRLLLPLRLQQFLLNRVAALVVIAEAPATLHRLVLRSRLRAEARRLPMTNSGDWFRILENSLHVVLRVALI